jgi:D-alanyl-D-alanine carboxypeptidase (penicillin-binding protein 5/6)
MKKLCAIMIMAMLAISTVEVFAQQPAVGLPPAASAAFTVDARAALLMEPRTGKILLEQAANAQYAPASVTKVMTTLLVYDAIADGRIKWDDTVTISAHAASMGGSQVFLEIGEQQSVRDLVKCMVISSANDASVALAEFVAGSEDAFVAQMNEKAKALGMNDTVFKNSCGLDAPGHVTSAKDIALMTRELMLKHPEIFEFSTIWMDSIVHRTARGESEFGLSNTNRLLKTYSGTTGMKTGSTADALYCISATAKRDDMELIAVIMGSPNPTTRFQEAAKLLDYGFANYSVVLGDEAGTVKSSVRIFKGEKEEVPVAVKTQVACLVAKGDKNQLESRIELIEALSAPVAQGAKAGEIIYMFDGNEVGRSDLVTTEGSVKAGLGDQMIRLLRRWTQSQ